MIRNLDNEDEIILHLQVIDEHLRFACTHDKKLR